MDLQSILELSIILFLTTISITYLVYFGEGLLYFKNPAKLCELYKNKEAWKNMLLSVLLTLPINFYILSFYELSPNSLLFFAYTNIIVVIFNYCLFSCMKKANYSEINIIPNDSFMVNHHYELKHDDYQHIDNFLDGQKSYDSLIGRKIRYGHFDGIYLVIIAGIGSPTVDRKVFKKKELSKFSYLTNFIALSPNDNYDCIHNRCYWVDVKLVVNNTEYTFGELYKINGDLSIISLTEHEKILMEIDLI